MLFGLYVISKMSYIFTCERFQKSLKMSQTNASENQEIQGEEINAIIMDMFTNVIEEHFEKAKSIMDELAQYLYDTILKEENPLEPLEQTTSQYIFACVAKIKKICLYLSAALDLDALDTGRNISSSRLSRFLRRMRGAADILNIAFQASHPTDCLSRIVILYRPTFKSVSVIWEKPPSVKFLKEIVVAHDETVSSCDCPICYESVTATEAIYTNCHHSFCVTCFKGLVVSVGKSTEEKRPVCPMCRVKIIGLKIGGLEVFNEVKNYLSRL